MGESLVFLQEQLTKMEGPYWKDLIPMILHLYPQIDIGKHFPVTTSQTIRKLPQSHNIRLGESLDFLQEQSTKMEGPYWKDLIPMTLHRYPQIDIGKHFPVTTSQTIRKLPQSHNIRLGESLVFLQEQSTKMEGPYWKDLIPMTLHRYPQIDIGKHFPVTTSQTIRKLPQSHNIHTTSDWENHSFSFRNNRRKWKVHIGKI